MSRARDVSKLITVIDAKGDLFAGIADNSADRVAVGTDGYVLTADSVQSTGVKWAKASAGAVGGGNDSIFYENDQTVTTSYTINTNKNAVSGGPISINSGVTVTVPTGSTWTVV